MSYSVIQPPVSLRFPEMSKEDLLKYKEWFLASIPRRLEELTQEVRRTPEYASWNPDLSPGSLDTLGRWFARQVEVRPRTQAEKAELASTAPWIDPPAHELTNRTFSLAFDVGMYLSQVLLANRKDLRWDQPLKTKKFADYGQPVLIQFGALSLNPVHIAITLAYGIADKSRDGTRLRGLYDYWVKQGVIS